MDSSGTPPTSAVPPVGWTSRIRQRSHGVLPHPDRPATPIVSPCRMVIETPRTAGLGLPRAVRYVTSRSSVTRTGSPTRRPGSRRPAGLDDPPLGHLGL